MAVATPIIVDLGKISEQAIDDLLGGGGQIVDDVEEVMKLVRSRVDQPMEDRLFLPVVAIYRRVRRGAADIDVGLSQIRSEEEP